MLSQWLFLVLLPHLAIAYPWYWGSGGGYDDYENYGSDRSSSNWGSGWGGGRGYSNNDYNWQISSIKSPRSAPSAPPASAAPAAPSASAAPAGRGNRGLGKRGRVGKGKFGRLHKNHGKLLSRKKKY